MGQVDDLRFIVVFYESFSMVSYILAKLPQIYMQCIQKQWYLNFSDLYVLTYIILCCHRLVLKWDNHRSKFVILHYYQTTCKKFYAEHSYKCGNTFFPHSFTISFAVGKIHKYYTYRIHFDWWSFSPIVKLLPPRIVYFYRDRPLFQMFSGTEIATIGWLVRFGGG